MTNMISTLFLPGFIRENIFGKLSDLFSRASALRTTPVTKQQSSLNLPIGSTTTAPESEQREAQTSTRLAILPLLILPLGVGADQASVSAATASAASLVSGVIAQLRSDLTVLPPVVSTSSPTSVIGCPGQPMQLNSLSYSPEVGALHSFIENIASLNVITFECLWFENHSLISVAFCSGHPSAIMHGLIG